MQNLGELTGAEEPRGGREGGAGVANSTRFHVRATVARHQFSGFLGDRKESTVRRLTRRLLWPQYDHGRLWPPEGPTNDAHCELDGERPDVQAPAR